MIMESENKDLVIICMQSSILNIDCNDCKNISITEERQRRMGNKYPHVCQVYGKRCFHKSIERNAWYIFPCDNCIQDEYKNYEET